MKDRSTEQFEEQRSRMRAIAFRMLGSFSEADDAVQETWLRFNRTGTDEIQNLTGWLTTVVTRVCLNMLEARKTRREASLETVLPEPAVSVASLDPEHEALLADSVGSALQVVLESLSPPERVAFVLHDLFSVPFDEVASVMGRSSVAVRQLASRAQRRVQGRPVPDRDFARLMEVLDPDVVLRVEGGAGAPKLAVVRGARRVANGAKAGAQFQHQVRLALVKGAPGAILLADGRPVTLASFTIIEGKIVEIDVLMDPERLALL